MRIPDSIIDDVRAASDIVDVISAFVPLKKRGKNFTGLCPFHQEKTPSFSVSQDKQMYYCFGCGSGGNVFTFVMQHDKVSFVEAVRSLAKRAGIAIPEEREGSDATATENEGLYAACREAERLFHENLTGSVEGKQALEYFRYRGFSDETIRKFGLGYSLNGWDSLVKYAGERKIDTSVFEKAGLILKREDGSGFYDRFRGRAMFPIYSTSGRTIAFGARKLKEDDPLGKYINSPETPIYNKSKSLYGLFQSKDAIRAKEMAIMVEGYADLITVSQAGIENIVASSGTALTEEQTRLIGRYAKTITLVYDADSAGSKATIRGVDLVIENGLDVMVAELPQGEDPDSFVRKNGGTAFQALVDGAVSFLDFKAGLFRAQGLFATPEGKTRAVRSLVETIARMKDELKRNFYIKSVSEKYDIYESVLFRELESALGQGRVRRDYERKVPSTVGAQETVRYASQSREMRAAERDLLKVMLEQGAPIARFVFEHVPAVAFRNPAGKRIIERMQGRLAEDATWDTRTFADEAADEDLSRLVADIIFNKYEISKGWGTLDEPDPWKIAEQAILRIREEELDQLISDAFKRLREAQARSEDVRQYHEQILTLQQEKKELRSVKLARN